MAAHPPIAVADPHEELATRLVADLGVPPCPAIVTDLLALAREEDPDFPRLAGLISHDPGLAAALMKTVNSPFYSLVVKATSVQQSLLFLGLRSAVRIVTGLALHHAFPESACAAASRIWTYSARLAPALGHLAQVTRRADRDDAYTFGLFRDCGTLLLATKYPRVYAEALAEHAFPHSVSLLPHEAGFAGTDHAQAGAALARSWYLPEALCLAVRHHHDGRAATSALPVGTTESRALVAMGLLADRLLDDEPSPVAGVFWERWKGAVLGALGLDEADLPALAEATREAASPSP